MQLVETLKSGLASVLSIAYPNNCKLCRQALFEVEETVCNSCLVSLPQTNYYTIKDNPIVQLFWGRVEIAFAAPLFFINKNNQVHTLMHLLKYRGQSQVGERLGKMLGARLIADDSLFQKPDYIVPVPLFWKKEAQRGYNQSYHISLGIAEKTGWEINTDNLIRAKENISQTRKGKFERWDNVEQIFALKNKSLFEGKHILLIDDVVTTGATLEACAHVLKTANCQISIATLATAGS